MYSAYYNYSLRVIWALVGQRNRRILVKSPGRYHLGRLTSEQLRPLETRQPGEHTVCFHPRVGFTTTLVKDLISNWVRGNRLLFRFLST